MYIPKAFAVTDLDALHGLIEQTPLALLVSQGEQGLQASHLPLLLKPDEGEFGTLYGHFARANPQWRSLAAGAEVLLVFQGADAYISPSFYPAKAAHGKVVPTWNYQAVHAHGRAEVFEDRERLLALVSALSDRHEQRRERPWAVSDAPTDYIDSMLRAIVGFALPISRIEGSFKLSQNKDAANFQGVQQGLQQSERPTERQLAQAMAALPPDA
ncbi:FMN-binding negative transcriptional regulator [Aquipseudomonas ullengensis]|uniref:FMN-binding negative transcriptional regulator n=1 Tax=Aquipseudomonas ullengensis TaxID=2759166 RepID=A0A7W4LJA6_9GAMM|nr:FMN-binding negative transcriptional regulator [Pseudomonas ullengensis]MBB2494215.1 FMN-binding negative transcriptional regulator [Pseudomonas ullengensis]